MTIYYCFIWQKIVHEFYKKYCKNKNSIDVNNKFAYIIFYLYKIKRRKSHISQKSSLFITAPMHMLRYVTNAVLNSEGKTVDNKAIFYKTRLQFFFNLYIPCGKWMFKLQVSFKNQSETASLLLALNLSV